MPTFEDSLLVILKDIAAAFDASNYKEVAIQAIKLKGSSGYAGASRLYYITNNMCMCKETKEYQPIIDFYPRLVEEAVVLRTFVR